MLLVMFCSEGIILVLIVITIVMLREKLLPWSLGSYFKTILTISISLRVLVILSNAIVVIPFVTLLIIHSALSKTNTVFTANNIIIITLLITLAVVIILLVAVIFIFGISGSVNINRVIVLWLMPSPSLSRLLYGNILWEHRKNSYFLEAHKMWIDQTND